MQVRTISSDTKNLHQILLKMSAAAIQFHPLTNTFTGTSGDAPQKSSSAPLRAGGHHHFPLFRPVPDSRALLAFLAFLCVARGTERENKTSRLVHAYPSRPGFLAPRTFSREKMALQQSNCSIARPVVIHYYF
jgi:hypothetical protein